MGVLRVVPEVRLLSPHASLQSMSRGERQGEEGVRLQTLPTR